MAKEFKAGETCWYIDSVPKLSIVEAEVVSREEDDEFYMVHNAYGEKRQWVETMFRTVVEAKKEASKYIPVLTLIK